MLSRNGRVYWTRLTLLPLAVALTLPAAAATNVNVDCPTGSLQAAINSLDPAGPNTITVTGTCEERIEIGDGLGLGYQGLVIQGPEGGTATITPPQAGQGRGAVVVIGGSHAIWLTRLVIRGGAIGLLLGDQAEVDTNLLTIENNATVGAQANANSVLFLVGATIRNNGQFGVRSSGVQPASLFLVDDADTGTPTVVEGHSLAGVDVGFAGAATLQGAVQVRNNGSASEPGSAGVRIARNSTLRVSPTGSGSPEISGNTGHGILAQVSSSVTLDGAAITNNTAAGVRVERLSIAEINPGNTFFGNGTFALSCDSNSWAVGDFTGVVPFDCGNVESKPGKTK